MKDWFLSFSLMIALLSIVPELCIAADKIRISVTNFNMSFLPSGLAVRRGFFKEEGIEAEVIRMNANVAITALAGGDTDYTMIFGSVVRAAIRGLPVRVVASFIDGSTHALIARSEFRSARELKGKTLGIQAYGATDHLAAMMMFKHLGVDPEKEIKAVALGPAAARVSALKEEVGEEEGMSPPADEEGRKMGFNILARAYELFSFPFVGLGTHMRKLKERPDEVKRTIRALIKANRFIRQNREGTIQTLAEWGRITPALAATAYDSAYKVYNLDGNIPDDGLLAVIEQAVKESKPARAIGVSDVSDMTALRDAQKELGIKGK